jgi:hypothetical protein
MKSLCNFARTLAAVCVLSLAAFGQGVTVTATLTDGQGIAQKTSYLHWQLWNCGNNVPQTSGGAIVAQQFDMRANPTTGVISGSVFGNDQILCGNVASTQWIVTEFKSSGQAGGQPQYYCLTNGETFNPATTQVCQVVPPPPGYQLIFGNPIQSQTLDQPAGTEFDWGGIVNFCSATVQCPGGSGDNFYTLEVNGGALSSGDTVNLNNSTPAAGSNGLNVIFQTSKSSSTDSVSAEVVGDGNAAHFLNGQGAFAAPGGASLQTNGTPNSSQSVLNLANGTNCTVTNTSGGTVTFNCPTGLPASPQVGDVPRYNVNGDSAWDAVIAIPKYAAMYVQTGAGLFCGGFVEGGPCTGLGSLAATAPTANDNPGFTYSAAATASTNSVVGSIQDVSANNGIEGFQAMYRWTHRFAIGSAGSITNGRFWQGLTYYNLGSTALPGGNTAFATDTPNQPFVGFRFSSTTDTAWQAMVGTSSSNTTVVNTGIAPDTNPHTFEFAWTGSAYVFFIDHAVVATISTNLPSASLTGTVMFWLGDNKNTANAVAGTFYHMIETLK